MSFETTFTRFRCVAFSYKYVRLTPIYVHILIDIKKPSSCNRTRANYHRYTTSYSVRAFTPIHVPFNGGKPASLTITSDSNSRGIFICSYLYRPHTITDSLNLSKQITVSVIVFCQNIATVHHTRTVMGYYNQSWKELSRLFLFLMVYISLILRLFCTFSLHAS